MWSLQRLDRGTIGVHPFDNSYNATSRTQGGEGIVMDPIPQQVQHPTCILARHPTKTRAKIGPMASLEPHLTHHAPQIRTWSPTVSRSTSKRDASMIGDSKHAAPGRARPGGGSSPRTSRVGMTRPPFSASTALGTAANPKSLAASSLLRRASTAASPGPTTLVGSRMALLCRRPSLLTGSRRGVTNVAIPGPSR